MKKACKTFLHSRTTQLKARKFIELELWRRITLLLNTNIKTLKEQANQRKRQRLKIIYWSSPNLKLKIAVIRIG